MSDIEQIKQKVKNLVPAFALGGSAQALVDDALGFLRGHLLSPEEAQLNHHRLAGEQVLAEEVLATLNSMPFLAPRRVVELHNAEKLSADDAAKLIDYLAKPAPSAVLILLFSKIDKRNKFLSQLEKLGFLTIFEEPKGADVVKYAARESKGMGLAVDSEALEFLTLALDCDMVAIKSALAKLALVFEKKTINVDDISMHILGVGTQDVFRLARSISEGKLSESLFCLGLLKLERENALKFLGVLIWQFRTILHIRHCFDRGMIERDVSQEVRIYGERLSWMSKVARLRTTSFHILRLCRLIECDLLLKSQKIAEPFTLIEKIIYQSMA